MRIAIITESFLPNVNGVTNSVLRIAEQLGGSSSGEHELLIIAPGLRVTHSIGRGLRSFSRHAHPVLAEVSEHYAGVPVVRVPQMHLPLIKSLPIGVPVPTVRRALREFQPDVVHLASPFALAGYGAWVAASLKIPAVAVYQTDVAGFAQNYHLTGLSAAAWRWTRAIHNKCSRTLAPSSAAASALRQHGVRRVALWGRGVDSTLFHPSRRDEQLRATWLGTTEPRRIVVGFVGRLAAEKHVERLAVLAEHPSLLLVIVGDGPERQRLQTALPGAVFTGALYGDELARAYASFDVFVHPGEHETFCQAIQEAQASGVPVIAPRAGGPRDLVQSNRTGLLLEVESLSARLIPAILSCFSHRAEFGAAARRDVELRSWGSVVDQLVRHYEEVCARAVG